MHSQEVELVKLCYLNFLIKISYFNYCKNFHSFKCLLSHCWFPWCWVHLQSPSNILVFSTSAPWHHCILRCSLPLLVVVVGWRNYNCPTLPDWSAVANRAPPTLPGHPRTNTHSSISGPSSKCLCFPRHINSIINPPVSVPRPHTQHPGVTPWQIFFICPTSRYLMYQLPRVCLIQVLSDVVCWTWFWLTSNMKYKVLRHES